jgi:hypothetical protein
VARVTPIRPSDLCRSLLQALDASEGRRRTRRRDTTADALGLAIKRRLLEGAVADDPEPEAFEAWLVEQCATADATVSPGAVRAMALDVFREWRLAAVSPEFAAWLAAGAPSSDRQGGATAAPP